MTIERIGGTAPTGDLVGANGAPVGSEATPSLLTDPVTRMLQSGDPAAEVAALLIQSYRQDRRDGRKLMQADEQRIEKEGAARAAAMRAKADATTAQAWATGIGEMAAGGMSAGGCAFAAPEAGEHDLGRAMSGGGQFLAGMSKPAAAAYGAKASELESEGAQHEASASAMTRAYDRHRDEVDEASDRMKKVLEFIGAAQDAQNASRRATLRA